MSLQAGDQPSPRPTVREVSSDVHFRELASGRLAHAARRSSRRCMSAECSGSRTTTCIKAHNAPRGPDSGILCALFVFGKVVSEQHSLGETLCEPVKVLVHSLSAY